LIIADKFIQFFFGAVKVFMPRAGQSLNRGAVSICHGLIHQNKAAFLIFGKNHMRNQINNFAKFALTAAQRLLALHAALKFTP
jgi:hypothetical protein